MLESTSCRVRCACPVRAPHTIRRETDGEGGAAAAAQRARGARDGGAEQRPLSAVAAPSVPERAVCAGCASGEGASVAARDARRRRRAAERSVRGEAAGRREVGGACDGRRALPRLRRGKA